MTLPYPDSPDIDENIATPIERIKDNLDYLDGLNGSGNVKVVLSQSIEMSTKSGVESLRVGFEPKAMVVFATYQSLHMNSWGAATRPSAGASSSSIDCCCVVQNEAYGGTYSSTKFMQLYQSAGVYIEGSVSVFTSTGAALKWTKNGAAGGKVGDIMYIFFG